MTDMLPEDVIAAVWQKIVWKTWEPVGNLSVLNVASAILEHYWMREIGLETVQLWKTFLNTRLVEIMPKMLAYERNVLAMGDIFTNMEFSETYNRSFGHSGESSEDVTGTNDSTSNSSQDTTSVQNDNGKSLYSDTPQNGLTDVIEGNYVTEATIVGNLKDVTDNSTGELKTESSMSSTSGKKDSYEDNDYYSKNNSGLSGDKVDILMRYEQYYKNAIQMIIENVADLFMSLL